MMAVIEKLACRNGAGGTVTLVAMLEELACRNGAGGTLTLVAVLEELVCRNGGGPLTWVAMVRRVGMLKWCWWHTGGSGGDRELACRNGAGGTVTLVAMMEELTCRNGAGDTLTLVAMVNVAIALVAHWS